MLAPQSRDFTHLPIPTSNRWSAFSEEDSHPCPRHGVCGLPDGHSDRHLGVPQGSVIAPTLFSIMMSQIASNIPSTPPFCSYGVFADDVVVWRCNKSLESAARGVQLARKSISDWCGRWGFEISASKSSSVVFTRSNRPMPRLRFPLMVCDEPMPENKHHSFLGITLDSRLTYSIHTKQVQSRAKSA